MVKSAEIRQSFLAFFKSKKHQIVKSAPVVPQNDPTLLFTNAGMNQFKDIFLGTRQRPNPRVADSQKCIRVSGKHNDLEQVGRDTYHHTFFEMLGNWSFGDYFKAEAIKWAWELLTNVWQLPKDRLYATVFEGDDTDNVPFDEEAVDEWKKQTDIDHSHVLAFDKKENFWEMGDTGPCGPCSEIHIDRGADYCDSTDPHHVCQVNAGCARFIELWNLVFIQYNRDENGVLHPLPAKHVDTGAGFERLVAVIQGKTSNYDTDVFTPLIAAIGEITGISYSPDSEQGVAFRVIADHVRALSFAIADGAIPGNEGRGYVLRRILRRASRFGRKLDVHEPFIFKLVDTLALEMGHAYPEINERRDYIAQVIASEEESFGRTLDRGIEIFEEKAQDILSKGENVFPGTDAFVLHDTFGFPLDLTQLMAEEKNLSVDVQAFNREMDAQRQRSSKSKTEGYQTIELSGDMPATEFVGYERDEVYSEVLKYEQGKLVLTVTPFYAESGGQVGDSGIIKNDSFEFRVKDTKKIGGHSVHLGELVSGNSPQPGDKVFAQIDSAKRRRTERNHTVTHLVHKSLRSVLGDHVQQAGSLVHPDYMRFDFTHFEALRPDEIKQVEDMVNEQILQNRTTTWQVVGFDEAKKAGAIALFGEKYSDKVRVVEVEGFSKELCGGTHVSATGEIGEFVIINETSVAAGIRRIECLTGMKAHHYLRNREHLLEKAAALLGCSPEETDNRLEKILDERKSLQQELKDLRQKSSKEDISELLKSAKKIDGVQVVAGNVHAKSVDELRSFGDVLRDRLGSGVGVLGSVVNEKLSFVCVVTKDVIEQKGLKAGDIVKQVAQFANGGGGGNPHMALAGAKDTSKLSLALSKVEEIVSKQTS